MDPVTWYYIGFYLVTTLLAYVLRPKPKVQDAVPQQADTPQALTSGAVPVIFGTVWITPNVVDYHSPRAEPIIECPEKK